ISPASRLTAAICDVRWRGIEFLQPLDQWQGLRRAGPGRFTRWMIPPEGRYAGFGQEAANRLDHRLECDVGAGPEVQDPFFGLGGRGAIVYESPATIKNRGSQGIRHIQRGKPGRAERQDKQHEL